MQSAVVIDVGSGTVKAGFSGAESPKSIFPTVIGSPRSSQLMIGGQNRDFFVGFEAQAKHGMLNLRSPIENGLISNWDDMEKILNHTFYNELLVNPEEHSVLLTEKPMTPRLSREKMIEIMFEVFHVRGYYGGIQAVLALLSLGRTTGMVWDAGEGVNFTVPIYEAYALPHAIMRSEISGHSLTEFLRDMLIENGYDKEKLELSHVKAMKEDVCTVALDFQADVQKFEGSKSRKKEYQLPGGLEVLYGIEGFKCPEALFTPSLVGAECDGIHQLMHIALEKCDIDARKELYANIILCGGTSMFRGLAERVEKEIISMAVPQMTVNVIATPERRNSVWIGGSLVASLDAFPQMMISSEEYREEGSQIVHRKCYS